VCCPRLFFSRLNRWRYREDMLKRAKALQEKQRSGQGAPPMPTLRFSSVSSTPTVPNFMPVHPVRRQGINSMQPRLVAPSFLAQTTQRLPPSLLAPHYSHLSEEAKSLSKQDSLGCDIPRPVIAAIHSTAFGLVLDLLCVVDVQWAASDAALTSSRWMLDCDWWLIRACWCVCQN
jgi:hypothetical protein